MWRIDINMMEWKQEPKVKWTEDKSDKIHKFTLQASMKQIFKKEIT